MVSGEFSPVWIARVCILVLKNDVFKPAFEVFFSDPLGKIPKHKNRERAKEPYPQVLISTYACFFFAFVCFIQMVWGPVVLESWDFSLWQWWMFWGQMGTSLWMGRNGDLLDSLFFCWAFFSRTWRFVSEQIK